MTTHDHAILTAHRDLGDALRDEDALLTQLADARARRESAEARLRQLARTEPVRLPADVVLGPARTTVILGADAFGTDRKVRR